MTQHGSSEAAKGTEREARHERHEERHEERERKRAEDRDILAKEQPIVLESSEDDPMFPAMQEFEVDEGGPKGSTKRHPGLVWVVIAIVAVAILVGAFVVAGDWMTPDQAERTAQAEFEEETVPEDLGAN